MTEKKVKSEFLHTVQTFQMEQQKKKSTNKNC